MSQTNQFADAYLDAQSMPPNDLTLDLNYMNIDMVTPIGRFLNIDVVKPRGVKQGDGTVSPPKYGIRLLFSAGTSEKPVVADMWRAIAMIADAKVPSIVVPNPQDMQQRMQVTGSYLLGIDSRAGGLHCPLRDGNKQYMANVEKNGIYMGRYFINAGMNPTTGAGDPQEPLCFDERNNRCSPTMFYRGCYGRAMIRVAWYEHPVGGKGVTMFLRGVQFARHGDKLGGDPQAAVQAGFAAAGPLPPIEHDGGGGPTEGPAPGAIPGVAAGFAAPPGQPTAPAPGYQPAQAPAPAHQPAPAGYVPPQQPMSPPQGGRPPGV